MNSKENISLRVLKFIADPSAVGTGRAEVYQRDSLVSLRKAAAMMRKKTALLWREGTSPPNMAM
jgi:hypothetical protein